jgi:hypothetical protein
MPRAKQQTPADELAEVDARIDTLVKDGEQLSARRGDAEVLIRTFADRREDAVMLTKLGEQVDVPDEAEQARLQRFVANAKVEHDAIGRARTQLEERREKIIAAGLPFFDAEGEAAAKALEGLGEALLAALDDFQAGARAKGEAWAHSRTGRRELGREQMPGVSFHDLGHLNREIADAMAGAWPGNNEERWRAFQNAEQGPVPARMSNRDAAADFEVIG